MHTCVCTRVGGLEGIARSALGWAETVGRGGSWTRRPLPSGPSLRSALSDQGAGGPISGPLLRHWMCQPGSQGQELLKLISEGWILLTPTRYRDHPGSVPSSQSRVPSTLRPGVSHLGARGRCSRCWSGAPTPHCARAGRICTQHAFLQPAESLAVMRWAQMLEEHGCAPRTAAGTDKLGDAASRFDARRLARRLLEKGGADDA